MTTPRKLSRGQVAVLAVAAVPMVAAGIAGGIGTYANLKDALGEDRGATALGVVAAGEGATAILALVMLGLTMLGQSSPAPVRVGLWTLPILAAGTGIVAADGLTEMVVYAMTPMAMVVAAEGLGLLARRIVVYRADRDVEAEARAADTVQRLAYHHSAATAHPSNWVRKRSERKSWALARKVGRDDPALAGRLLELQRTRLQSGADAALSSMFGAGPVAPTEPAPGTEDTTPAVPVVNAEESTESTAKRSYPDQHEQSSDTPTETTPEPAPAVEDDSAPAADAESTPTAPVRPLAVAAAAPRPARVSAPIPTAARTTAPPRRTWDQLLTEAQEATTDWSTEELSANAIRQAVRTSAVNARRLREELRADRDGSPAGGEAA